jgi:hypothetical protein
MIHPSVKNLLISWFLKLSLPNCFLNFLFSYLLYRCTSLCRFLGLLFTLSYLQGLIACEHLFRYLIYWFICVVIFAFSGSLISNNWSLKTILTSELRGWKMGENRKLGEGYIPGPWGKKYFNSLLAAERACSRRKGKVY